MGYRDHKGVLQESAKLLQLSAIKYNQECLGILTVLSITLNLKALNSIKNVAGCEP